MFAARPRSPLAFSLPVMNIITGLALLDTTLRKSTGPSVMVSRGSRWGESAIVHAPSAMITS